MQAQLPLVAQLRETLWQNGYRAVAIPIGKKFPVDIAWTEKARENPPKVLSEYNPAKPGTGILCDGLRAIDIDIDDEAAALSIFDWCWDNLGPAPVRVRANAVRMLLLYRAAVGEPRKAKVWNKETTSGVEVLGHGNQFHAYGQHATTGCKIEWLNDRGPHNQSYSELPAVTEEQIKELLRFAAPYVGEAARVMDAHEPLAQPMQTVAALETEDIERLLAAIPNSGKDYEFWRDIGMAVFSCNNSNDAFEAWRRWSQHAGSDSQCKRLWNSLIRGGVRNITAGTLFHHAQLADPTFRLPSQNGVDSAIDRILIRKYGRWATWNCKPKAQ